MRHHRVYVRYRRQQEQTEHDREIIKSVKRKSKEYQPPLNGGCEFKRETKRGYLTKCTRKPSYTLVLAGVRIRCCASHMEEWDNLFPARENAA